MQHRWAIMSGMPSIPMTPHMPLSMVSCRYTGCVCSIVTGFAGAGFVMSASQLPAHILGRQQLPLLGTHS